GLSAFTGFDWAVLALVGLLSVGGLMQGFTSGVLSLLAWVAAVFAVRWLHEPATAWLAGITGGEASGAIVAFLLLFFGTVLVGRAIAGAAGGAAKKNGIIGPFDRVLGLGFGALKGVLLATAAFVILQFATGLFDEERKPPAWLAEARSAPLLTAVGETMVTWIDGFDQPMSGVTEGILPVPRMPQLPPGHPMQPRQDRQDRGGQTPEERDALDRLLEEGAEEAVEI
ncbi:MAG: CvpA family protein, partial [Thermaurantiacus sp.]